MPDMGAAMTGSRAGTTMLLGAGLALALALPTAQAGETRRIESIDEFTQIVLVGSSVVEVRQGDRHELQLKGDAEDLDQEPFYIKGGDLLVLGKSKARGKTYPDVRFRVELPELESLRVNGSGMAYVKPFVLDGEFVEFIVDGSGDIKLYGLEGGEVVLRVKGSGDIQAASVDVGHLEAVVSGSGDLYVGDMRCETGEFVVTGSGDLGVTEKGEARDLEVSVVGSGDAHLKTTDAERAEINVVGSGSVVIGEIREQLNASILGSGDIRYLGDPEVDKVEFGSGEVRRRK